MEKKKGISILTVLGGCGCLLLLSALAVAGAATWSGYWVYSNASELVESGESYARQGADRVKNEAKSRLDTFDLADWDDAPLTLADVDSHVAFMSAWQSSPAAKAVESGVDDLKKSAGNEDPGAMDTLRSLNSMRKVTTGHHELQQLYDTLAAKHGGGGAVMSRYFRVVAVASAAHDLGASMKQGAHSDAVAAALVTRRPEFVTLHDSWIALHRRSFERVVAVTKGGKVDPPNPAEATADATVQKAYLDTPGTLLLGRIPNTSLETWKALKPDTRELLATRYARVPLSGFSVLVPDALTDLHGIARALLNVELARVQAEVGLQ